MIIKKKISKKQKDIIKSVEVNYSFLRFYLTIRIYIGVVVIIIIGVLFWIFPSRKFFLMQSEISFFNYLNFFSYLYTLLIVLYLYIFLFFKGIFEKQSKDMEEFIIDKMYKEYKNLKLKKKYLSKFNIYIFIKSILLIILGIFGFENFQKIYNLYLSNNIMENNFVKYYNWYIGFFIVYIIVILILFLETLYEIKKGHFYFFNFKKHV